MIFLLTLPVAILLYGGVFYAAWTGSIWNNCKTYDCKTEPFMYWSNVGVYIVLATVSLALSLRDLL